MRKYKLGFVGAGNMAEAICRAVLANDVFSSDEISAYDPADARTQLFREQFDVNLSSDNATLVKQCETIVLAVKPQQVNDVLQSVGPVVNSDQLMISIAAGISTGVLEAGLKQAVPIVRAMPNTPLLVGVGMTGLCRGTHASDEHLKKAERIFAAAGETIITDESYMDAITALSGSGPAYFFYLVEAMQQAGVDLGLPAEQVATLAGQTCLGAGQMLLKTRVEPKELRRRVTSPGGTTEAALRVLEGRGVKECFVAAVKAACERSKELGTSSGR